MLEASIPRGQQSGTSHGEGMPEAPEALGRPAKGERSEETDLSPPLDGPPGTPPGGPELGARSIGVADPAVAVQSSETVLREPETPSSTDGIAADHQFGGHGSISDSVLSE